jgi:ribosomal protein S18 acetylase RimI-like enzyme
VLRMEIRLASEQDDAELRTLDRANWSWDVSPAPPSPPGKSFFSETSRPGDVLVAVADGSIAGYVKLGAAIPLESNRHVLEVKGLAVDPAKHQCGVGRRLLAAAAREASARGARRLTLRVLAPNAPARALYEASGFRVEGVLREEFKLDGRYVDDVLMALDLTGANDEPMSHRASSRVSLPWGRSFRAGTR